MCGQKAVILLVLQTFVSSTHPRPLHPATLERWCSRLSSTHPTYDRGTGRRLALHVREEAPEVLGGQGSL